MEPDLKRLAHGLASKQLFSFDEFVSVAVGQARVEADVIFVLRKRPKRYPQLKRLGYGYWEPFDDFERYVRRDLPRSELDERRDGPGSAALLLLGLLLVQRRPR
jgi:hypothetical protein